MPCEILPEKSLIVLMQSLYGLWQSLLAQPECWTFPKLPSSHPAGLTVLVSLGVDYTYPGAKAQREAFMSEDAPAEMSRIVVRTADLGLPKEINNMIAATVCMPQVPGCPYQVTEYQKNGLTCWVVHGISIEPVDNIADSIFSTPQGWKDLGK